MPKHRAPLVAALILSVTSAVGEVEAQRPGLAPDVGMKVAYADGVGLLVRGIVFNAETGEAFGHAQVEVMGTGHGALTDDRGRFEMVMDEPGVYALRASIPGFETVSDSITVHGDASANIQIGLIPDPGQDCEVVCIAPGCPAGVRVEVLDFETGARPPGRVSLIVEGGPVRDSASVPVGEGGAVALSAGGQGPYTGPFRVKVSSDGRADWVAEGVWLAPACPFSMTPVIQVFMFPDSGEPRGGSL